MSQVEGVGLFRFQGWIGLCLGVCLPLAAAATPQLAEDVDILVRAGVVESGAYWLEHAVEGGVCDGERVGEVLLKLARVFEKGADRESALGVLERRRIIWNDYWARHAVKGGACHGPYVANLFRAAADPLLEVALVAEAGVPEGWIPGSEPAAFVLPGAGPDRFNLVLGTQTFQPAYQFTTDSRLVETARAIRELGCTAIKFELSPRYAQPRGNVPQANPAIRTLTELARDEPSHRRVLDLPFTHVLLWAHTFGGGEGKWRTGFSAAAAEAEYREIHELTAHLLRTYNGTGRIFLLGHWEGDGWLRGTVAQENDARVTAAAVRGMADWLNTRQRAVDDARRETPHDRVQVWHYTEVNHVKLAMQGRPALVNRVLPLTQVDLVSYSCYDTQGNPALLKAALSYIESQLPTKPGLAGRRVFIGEYGFPRVYHSPIEQERRSRAVMRAGLEWGCPLILYWQLYNNEVEPGGRQRGFWLIDDQRVAQPIHETHRRFLAWGRRFVTEELQATGRVPTSDRFRREAIRFLDGLPPPPGG